jgi:hypothetical protein
MRPPTRLVLEVDPSVSPSEVRKQYKALRRELFRGRVRRIEDRRLQLAVFVANHRDQSWESLFRSWTRIATGLTARWMTSSATRG